MVYWGRRFPPKNEQKQVNLRYHKAVTKLEGPKLVKMQSAELNHSSKVEFVRSFFGGNQ